MSGAEAQAGQAPPDSMALVFHDGVIMLVAALACVIVFRRFGLGAVLGYLVAGALVGPFGLALVGGANGKMAIAEVGIILLLFLVGLELNPARLWRLRRDIFGLGLAQLLLCGAALSALVMLAGFSTTAAIAIGFPLALSSTAQVLPGLKSSGRINSPFGEKAFSVLLFQDLAIVPLITLIAGLSRAPADPAAPPGWMMAAETLGAITALVLTGRFVLRPLLGLIGRLGERELFVAVGLFTVLASAGLMHMLHLSPALGAFVAGVMLADSPYRHEIESDVEPFRTILLGLFFIAVGMALDLSAIAARPVFVVGLALALVVTKALLIAALAWVWGVGLRPAIGLGLLLSQGGEFGFVLFSQATAALLIAPEAATLFNAIVTLSMATTPLLLLVARRFEFARPAEGALLDGPELSPPTRAIVVGYGRFGQTVAQLLMGAGVGVTLIDRKPAQIELSSQFDTKVYYGDGTRLDLLRRAGAEEANLLAFCIDGDALDAATAQQIREAFPQAALFVRVYDRRHLIALNPLDLAGTTRELFESAIRMGLEAAASLGLDDEELLELERQYRENDRTRLDAQIAAGDLKAARHLMFRPDRAMRRAGDIDTPLEANA